MGSKPRSALFSIGYEGRTLDDFLAALVSARVSLVVDVRELPLSRRRGFSKTKLSLALKSRNIAYAHLRKAGNPFRDQRQDIKHCLGLYRSHVKANPSVVDLVDLAIKGRRAALLCFESAPEACHRSVLIDFLGQRRSLNVKHL